MEGLIDTSDLNLGDNAIILKRGDTVVLGGIRYRAKVDIPQYKYVQLAGRTLDDPLVQSSLESC